jgi:bifunctional non-homologous end joining protein LigD
MASLRTYRARRDFDKTPEPRGSGRRREGRSFVIHKHAARRLHYDLRLELDGVMKSWAITKGPSLVPGEKRLAIRVEDHPLEYNRFEGTIPPGEYGAGTVMIWDRGRWRPEGDPHQGLQKGHLDFELQGAKLKGRWHLVRMRKRPGERGEPWLLIKSADEHARRRSDRDILDEEPRSIATGRSMAAIAARSSEVQRSSASKARAERPRRRRIATDNLRREVAGVTGVRKGPLPDFISPCLASLDRSPPRGERWVHEIKFDGYRIQARIDGDLVRLSTRTGLDWTARFASIAKACAPLAPHQAILDGEIVAVDERGASDFAALQEDLKSGRQDRLAYYVFDLLHLDGFDLTGAPLIERKRLLQRLIEAMARSPVVRLSEHFAVDGPVMLEHVCALKLEGIVSKLRDAPYRSGRTGDWRKTKCVSSQEFVVIGYEPSDKRGRAIRSLLIGYYDNKRLRYAGRIGTGWSAAQERDLSQHLASLADSALAVVPVPRAERNKPVKWVNPKLVIEVDFRGWTAGNLVRQGAFKGIREDKPATQVVRERARLPRRSNTGRAALHRHNATKSTARPVRPRSASMAGVALTHPDRVYWEDAGITKQMLAEYYEAVWDFMRPHVTGRVLALVRCPSGVSGHCFFQKHASPGIDVARLRLVTEPDGERSLAIDDLQGLIALVQAGGLEIHLRGSTVAHLEQADRLVFDLDPGPGVGWSEIAQAAREVRHRLRELGLESFVKATGGRGLHVVLPVEPVPWDAAKAFCRRIAARMAADAPTRYTATAAKASRGARIFIDHLRNSREATTIAPYSTRARPGASVATPLAWEEIGRLHASNRFDVRSLPRRLARLKDDPWKELGRIRQTIPDFGGRSRAAG